MSSELVQRFYDGIVKSENNAERNRIAFALLDVYPALATLCFQDYGVGYPDRKDYALPLVLDYDDAELVQRLIDLGADIHGKSRLGFTLLQSFLVDGSHIEKNLPVIELLLKAGVDVNQPLYLGLTALHYVVRYRQAPLIVPLLLRYGADPNRRNDWGATALHLLQDRTLLDLLMAHGADINVTTIADDTPLMTSIENRLHVVKEMVAYGADIHAKCALGWTAMHMAATAYDEEDAQDIVFLLQAGASCQVKDEQGYTPLHVAASLFGVEAARLLLEAGAEVNAKNERGVTPLDLVEAQVCPFYEEHAEEEEYAEMAALLRAHGATFTPGLLKRGHKGAGQYADG